MAKVENLEAKIIDRLIEDYNVYSELVAINHAQGQNDEWNRGQRSMAKEYLDSMCEITGTVLVFEMTRRKLTVVTSTTGQEIEYLTARRQR